MTAIDPIKPSELDNNDFDWTGRFRNSDVWSTLMAARNGELERLKQLISNNPALVRCEYWYTPPLHFAVREGHLHCVQYLLEQGADLTHLSLIGEESLVTVANDHERQEVAAFLERTMKTELGSTPTTNPIHEACSSGNTNLVNQLINEDPGLINLGDHVGRRPIHYAVERENRDLVKYLLNKGAHVDALGYSSDNRLGGYGFRPVVSALWHHPYWRQRNDYETVKLLLEHGADYTMTVAAALGDIKRVQQLLDTDRSLCNHQEPGGKRAISAAAERKHEEIVNLLLDAGCDPNLEEGPNCPRGYALWSAARFGFFGIAETLLKAGADPNANVESSGNPTESAVNGDMRSLLYQYGGRVGFMQLFHENNTDVIAALLQRAPEVFTPRVCADGFTMAVSSNHETVVKLMLNAGLQVPSVVTVCQTYLWHNLKLTEELLQNGMDPNLPNWQQIRPLHHMAVKGQVEAAKLFIRYGANPSLIDEEFCSTPLGWAAKFGQYEFAKMLLMEFPEAKTHNPEGIPSWATPLAWAKKRGHNKIEELLQTEN